MSAAHLGDVGHVRKPNGAAKRPAFEVLGTDAPRIDDMDEQHWEPSDADAPDAPPPHGEDPESGPQAQEHPTAEDPLRGLKFLGLVALRGRERILELAATPVHYVWQDIAVAGTVVLIAGPPAEGKTTLLFLLLAARANTGKPISILNREMRPAPAGKFVVLIEGEHSEASTARKLLKSLQLLAIEDSALDRVIVVARKAVTLGSPEWGDVVRMVQAGVVSDIAIDTIARVAPADANDEREQVAVFNTVAQAIECAPEGQEKPLVWTVAHTRKNNNTGDLSDVAGSVQRTGQADTVILIKGEKIDGRTVSTKATFVKLREDPDDYPLPVTFSIVDGCLNSSTETACSEALEKQILAQLHTGPKSKTALATTLNRSKTDIEGALTNLFSVKAIVSKTGTVRGKPTKLIELRQPVGQNQWEDFQP